MPSDKKPTITATQRWLDLISYLLGRRYPVAAGELMERLPGYAQQSAATARRYLERDKADLLEIGVPIEYTDGTDGQGAAGLQGYYLRSHDFFLPYLQIVSGAKAPSVQRGMLKAGTLSLSAAQAGDVIEALQRVASLPQSPFAVDARAAYAKLVLDLDVGALGDAPVHIAAPPGAGAQRETLNTLSDALIERRTVRLRYRAPGRASAAERTVDPYGLIAAGGRWYLVGRCHGADAERQYRVERIESLSAQADAGGAPAPHFSVPDDFSIARYAHRRAWELGEQTPVEARVRFRFPWTLWAERNGYGEADAEESGGAVVRRFRVHAVDPFLRWLLSSEAEPELVGPPELLSELQALAAAVVALYDDAPTAGLPAATTERS
jgi:proteasome accessory factor B